MNYKGLFILIFLCFSFGLKAQNKNDLIQDIDLRIQLIEENLILNDPTSIFSNAEKSLSKSIYINQIENFCDRNLELYFNLSEKEKQVLFQKIEQEIYTEVLSKKQQETIYNSLNSID